LSASESLTAHIYSSEPWGPSDRPHIRLLAPGLRSLGYLCSYLVSSRDG
jgi:hypothetical protein